MVLQVFNFWYNGWEDLPQSHKQVGRLAFQVKLLSFNLQVMLWLLDVSAVGRGILPCSDWRPLASWHSSQRLVSNLCWPLIGAGRGQWAWPFWSNPCGTLPL